MSDDVERQNLCAAHGHAEKEAAAAFENLQSGPDGEKDALASLEDARERLAAEVEKTRKYLAARR